MDLSLCNIHRQKLQKIHYIPTSYAANDLTAVYTGSGGSSNVKFNFTYDSTSDKLGCLDNNGAFVPFGESGTDVSDTTATASDVLTSKYFYTSSGVRTQGTYVPLDTSDANARARNIESGYSAYVNGIKINGTAYIEHSIMSGLNVIGELSSSREQFATCNVGDFCLIGGGRKPSNDISIDSVEVFDSDGTQSYLTLSSNANIELGASQTENYGIFFGGRGRNYIIKYDINVFNSSLTRTDISTSYSGFRVRPTNVGNYTLFQSDLDSSTGNWINRVVYINNSLSIGVTNLSTLRIYTTPCSNDNYALFSGGQTIEYRDGMNYTTDSNYIDTFNSSMSRGSANLSRAKAFSSGGFSETYAFVAGGIDNGTFLNHIDIFNKSLSRSSSTLRSSKASTSSTTLSKYVIFAGGNDNSSAYYLYDSEYFDSKTLSKSNLQDLQYFTISYDSNQAGHTDSFAIFPGRPIMTNPPSYIQAYFIS